jgi:hypothetical protein
VTSAGPFDNGLHAPAYVPLTDVDPMIGQHLLTALGRARIAAYLVPTEAAARQRLYVASEERVDARTIVVAAVRALSDDEPAPPVPADPLAGLDTDSEFHALIADWKIDTVAAIREAERDLTREDADWRARLIKPQSADEVWLDEDHYVPPEPPPLPRLAAPTIIAMLVLAGSIVFLALGDRLGLGDGFTLVLGILGLLLGVGILFTRVRDHYRDEDDDGAAI